MELNDGHLFALEFIEADTDNLGRCFKGNFTEKGLRDCAHLLQVGYIGFSFEMNGYYITDKGREALHGSPADKEAQIKAEIQRLEQALWVKREELAALRPQSLEQQIAKRWHGYEGK